MVVLERDVEVVLDEVVVAEVVETVDVDVVLVVDVVVVLVPPLPEYSNTLLLYPSATHRLPEESNVSPGG